jgi:hypothetical protein
MGEAKLRDFGSLLLAEIAGHLQSQPRQFFADESFAAPAPARPARSALGESAWETLRRFQAGQTVDQIARDRGLVLSTVHGHLVEAIERGEKVELTRFFTDVERRQLSTVFEENDSATLSSLFEALNGAYNYDRLRIFRAIWNSRLRA